jgi:hypothetical protein
MVLKLCIMLAVLLASAPPSIAPAAPVRAQAIGAPTLAYPSAQSLPRSTVPLQATGVTTTTLTAVPSPSVMTETVWLEATVSFAHGEGTPTGTISFYGDGTLLGVEMLSIDNWVRLELPTLATGTHVLTATYSGDNVFAPSSSTPLSHIVRRSGVRLGLYSEDAFQVTFRFEVVTEAGVPDGSVTVSDGASSCTASVATGRCTIMFPNAGPRQLTAVYSGGAILESNVSAPLDYTVQRYPTDIRTTVTPPWVDAGQPVTVTFVLMPRLAIPRWPSGIVTVRVGDVAPVCSVFVNAAGACTFIPAGRFPIRIDYSGDDYFAANTISLRTPVRLGTRIGIAAAPNPASVNQVITLTAGLGSDGIACATFFCAPTGQVVYYDNGNFLASAGVHPRVGAVFPVTATLTTLGTHIITGSYSGDTNYAGSTSSPLTVQVVPQTRYLPFIIAP